MRFHHRLHGHVPDWRISAKLSANNCSIAPAQGRLEPAAFFLSRIIGSILSFAQATREISKIPQVKKEMKEHKRNGGDQNVFFGHLQTSFSERLTYLNPRRLLSICSLSNVHRTFS